MISPPCWIPSACISYIGALTTRQVLPYYYSIDYIYLIRYDLPAPFRPSTAITNAIYHAMFNIYIANGVKETYNYRTEIGLEQIIPKESQRADGLRPALFI